MASLEILRNFLDLSILKRFMNILIQYQFDIRISIFYYVTI